MEKTEISRIQDTVLDKAYEAKKSLILKAMAMILKREPTIPDYHDFTMFTYENGEEHFGYKNTPLGEIVTEVISGGINFKFVPYGKD